MVRSESSAPCPPAADRESRELAAAFRALANPHRLAIYLRLLGESRRGEATLSSCALQTLIDRLDIGAPTVSHHVRELVSAGLMSVRRDGRFLHCTLDDAMRRRLAGVFGD